MPARQNDDEVYPLFEYNGSSSYGLTTDQDHHHKPFSPVDVLHSSLSEDTPLLLSKKGSFDSSSSDSDFPLQKEKKKKEKTTKAAILNHVRVTLMTVFTLMFIILFAIYPELEFRWKQFSVSRYQSQVINISSLENPILKLYLSGQFSAGQPSRWTENVTLTVISVNNVTEPRVWKKALPRVPWKQLSRFPSEQYTQNFDYSGSGDSTGGFLIHVASTSEFGMPISLSYNTLPPGMRQRVIYAAIILVVVYILITFELVHRTLSALLGSTATIAVLATLNEKPTLERVLSWMHYETLLLLAGMMIIVAVFVETGVFDWAALFAFKLVKGRTWPLVTVLCAFSAVISAFMDNVTTMLLIAPVTIKLCETLKIDPKIVLIAEVMFANVGGAATAVGDPPNVLLVSNREIQLAGIDFAKFTLHLLVGIIFVSFAAYGLLRLMFMRKEYLGKGDGYQNIEKEATGKRQRSRSGSKVASPGNDVVKQLLDQRINTLDSLTGTKEENMTRGDLFAEKTIAEMEKKYFIRDRVLLIKCSIVLLVVIVLFFAVPFIPELSLGLGWIAIFGGLFLLVLADYQEMDKIIERIEWSTLLFFAGLFVMMEGLNELGLISWVADRVTDLIRSVPDGSRLAVAVIVILWVSAILSSFVDNIPFTTAMIPVILQLASDTTLCLPLEPLVWALAFGACLGGNGTLIGASANVVCAGIAEAHGYPISFKKFFKIGFPMVLVTTLVSMVYLVICHVATQWHEAADC